MHINSRLFDFISRLHSVHSFEDAWLVYLDALEKVGISEAFYGWNIVPDETSHHEDLLLLSSYSKDFMREYHGNNCSEHDVLIDWCERNNTPLEWGNMGFAFTEGQKVVEEISEAYQLEHGFTIPLRIRGGINRGGSGLSATGIGRKEFEADVKPHFEYIYALTQTFHMYVQKFPCFTEASNEHDRVVKPLNEMETSVLHWLCHGLSIQEIADYKIYRSVQSVDKYIRQAKVKLNARNRDQLIAKALILNLI